MDKILSGVIESGVYAILGIILMGIGFLIVKLISPFSMRKEIEEDQNTSLGIIIGAVILGISIIVAAAISGPSVPENSRTSVNTPAQTGK